MTRAVAIALLSHWRRNPLQLITLVLGIALATALWSGVQAINAEARASYDAAATTLGGLDLPQLEAADGGPVTLEDFVELRRAGIMVSPLLRGEIALRPGAKPVTLTGIEPLTAPRDLWPEGGAAWGAAADVIFVGPGVEADAERHPNIIRRDDLPSGQALTDIATAQRLLGRADFDALLITGPPSLGAPDPARIRPALRRSSPAVTADPAALTESFRLNLAAFGALCFIVGLFIVRSTIGLAMAQRGGTVRILRALGVPVGRIAALMLAELAGLALLAGALGVALGYLVAGALMPGVSATLDGIYGAGVGTDIALRPVWWLGGLALAVIGTLLAAAGPLAQAARGEVLEPSAPRLGRLLLAPVGLTLCAVAGLLAWQADGLPMGFGAIAALLLGGAALAPVGLGLATRALSHLARRPVTEWLLAEAHAQIPQMSLAMTALLLALAANIGVNTMVGSFRASFVGFLDHRLAAELYVSGTEDAGRIRAAMSPEDRLLPLRKAEIAVYGAPVELYGVVDDPTYREDWVTLRALPGAWDRVYQGRGAVVNEQLFYRNDLRLGDPIPLPDGPAELVAVIADYGNPLGQIIVAQSRLDRIAPDTPPRSFALRTNAPEQLAARLTRTGIPPARIQQQAEVKALSLRVFERTFAVTGALSALTLGVAGFAILTTLLTLGDMRLPRLAPLWAMGVTRRQLALAELAQIGLLAALTVLYAVPLGLALSWLLLTVVNVEAFGWRLPFLPAPLAWLGLGALGLAAALAAALWPVAQLARLNPRRLLEVFSRDA